jgi:hypothetical protein
VALILQLGDAVELAQPLQSLWPAQTEPAYDKVIGTDGLDVRVSGDKVRTDLKAEIDPAAPSALAGLNPESYEVLAPVYKVGPSGKLAALTTIRLPIDRAPADGGMLVVMTRSTPDGEWQMVENVRLSEDRMHVEFEVDHLSWFETYNMYMNKILDPFTEFLAKGIGGGVLRPDEAPTCEGTDKAKADGYTAMLDTRYEQALSWCYGFEQGAYIVRVVGNRRYPMEAKLTNVELVPDGDLRLRADKILEATGRVVMMPGETAVFRVKDLAKGSSAKLEFGRSSFTHYLDGMDTVSMTLFKHFLGKDDTAAKHSALTVIRTRECYNAIANPKWNAIQFDEACFDQAFYEEFFGKAVAKVMKRIGTWLMVGDVMRGAMQAYTDGQWNQDRHVIKVSRAGDLDKFAGEWLRRTDKLTIRRDGTATHWQAFSAQGCVTDAAVQCDFNATLSLKVDPSGVTATATYQDLWLTEGGGARRLPLSSVDGSFPAPGDTIRMELAGGFLSTLMPSGKAFVFCSPQAIEEPYSPCN